MTNYDTLNTLPTHIYKTEIPVDIRGFLRNSPVVGTTGLEPVTSAL
ncbi:uncharacterized protein METZ01_LOCUS201287 [marine metagenome]|uniref:Uncharacterized protein n=1 Tax=marine metagenome TaxID=408172 RepID=A0A382EER2_9ZZZZ